MSEIVLAVRNGSYEDGDVIEAFSEYRIKRIYTEEETHLPYRDKNRRFILNGSGLIEPDSLVEDFHSITKEYKLERLSAREARIVRGEEEIRFETGVPFYDFSGKLVQMDVAMYFQRRIKTLQKNDASGIPLFGYDVARPWCYMGKSDLAEEKLNLVWNKIEHKTHKLRTDAVYQSPDVGESPTRTMLVVRTDLMTVQEEALLKSPLYKVDDNGDLIYYDVDGNISSQEFGEPKIIKKRAIQVNWRGILTGVGATERQVLDKGFRIGKVEQLDKRNLYKSKDQPRQKDRAKLVRKWQQ